MNQIGDNSIFISDIVPDYLSKRDLLGHKSENNKNNNTNNSQSKSQSKSQTKYNSQSSNKNRLQNKYNQNRSYIKPSLNLGGSETKKSYLKTQ